jgi:hypothetical protein
MKWLLITNNGNPGDIWVRLGVQEVIRHFDKDPTWIIRERDHRAKDPYQGLTEPEGGLDFDYSVVCGMPLIWSHFESNGQHSSTTQHASWSALNGWLKPEKMIVAGFGIYLACPNSLDEWKMVNQEKILGRIRKFLNRCKIAYARSPLIEQLIPGIGHLHCPSTLCLKPAKVRDLKLCNFMPGGTHYPHLAPEAAKVMKSKRPELARKLIEAGFHFAAHRRAERDIALELGWPKDRIFLWMYDGTGVNMLDIYSRCAKYIGNRIHGGIMSRAAGAEVIVIGSDTRLAAVKYVGGEVYTPLTMPDLDEWIQAPPKTVPYYSDTVRHIHVSWWSAHLGLPTIK